MELHRLHCLITQFSPSSSGGNGERFQQWHGGGDLRIRERRRSLPLLLHLLLPGGSPPQPGPPPSSLPSVQEAPHGLHGGAGPQPGAGLQEERLPRHPGQIRALSKAQPLRQTGSSPALDQPLTQDHVIKPQRLNHTHNQHLVGLIHGHL